jgi:hypothetical protein
MEGKFEICPVCRIARIDGVFHYSHNNTPTTSDDVAGLVCKHILKDPIKCANCINTNKYSETGDSFESRLGTWKPEN